MFWGIGVPIIVFGVIYYAYQQPGWVGTQVQHTFGPILDPLIHWFDRVI